MKTKLLVIIKSLLIGLIIFMIINYFEGKLYYGIADETSSHIINIYFYPLLIIADIINLVIPISRSNFYLEFSEPIYNRTTTLIIGILYTSTLIYTYFWLKSLGVFKKIPKILMPSLFFILIISFIFLSAMIVNSKIIHPVIHVHRYNGP
jgi:hypothetical protein